MKKIFWGFTIILLLILGTAVVGPSMIDWNRYKGEVTQQAKIYTGRDLKILGDVQVSLFPAPAIIANDVSFSNLPGAATTEMIKLQRAEVRIALSPLLAGQIKVETVRLIKPVIELELLADGRQNWNFETPKPDAPAQPSADKPAASAASSPKSEPTVVLDDFTIVDGALTYRDSKAGTIEKIEGLNARIEAASLLGPFQSKGSLKLRQIPLTYDITVGEVIKERTLPLNMRFGVGAGDTSLQIGGTLLSLSENPKFKGTLKGEGKNLSLLIEAITRTPAPPALAQLFSVEANISASQDGGELTGLQMRLADSRVEGDVAFEVAETPRFSVSLTAGRFDLDKWLSGASAPTEPTKTETDTTSKAATKKAVAATPSSPAVAGGVEIPNNISGSVIVSVEALVYRGEAINDVLITTELADGIVQLSQFSAQFPGGSDIAMSGLLSSPGGKPNFSGAIEATTNDLRQVTKWLGVALPGVPADRLRKIEFSSDVTLTPGDVQLQNIDLKFDSTRVTGATTVALRSRPAFGLNLTVDQIEVDAYFDKSVKPVASATKKIESEKNSESQSKGAKSTQKPVSENPFKGLAALGSFDANAVLTVKRLGWQGDALSNVVLDATLYDGSLDIRKMNVGRFAGASVATTGQINNLRDIPVLKNLHVVAKAKNLTPLVRYAGLKLPFNAKGLGASTVDIRANGSVLKPKIKAAIETAGATVSASGNVSMLPVGDLFDLAIKVSHPDLPRLLRTLGVKYRPAGNLGALVLSTQASGKPTHLKFKQMSGKLGKLAYSGTASLNLENERPIVSADLHTGALILDMFLPAAQNAALEGILWGALKRRPVVWPGPDATPQSPSLVRIATKGRWPTDPIDLSVLNSFDANFALKAPLVAYSKYLFDNVQVGANIKNGTLKTERLMAGVFGGKLDGIAEISTVRSNQFASTFSLIGINIADALKSLTGKATASGRLNANLDVIASGKSVADIVSSLAGTGAFTMKDVDVTAGSKGSAFAGVYNLLTSLNRLGSSRSGNNADVAGTFQIARGIAKTNDFKLASALGNGSATGTVDLPGWKLNMKGQIELQQSALTQILQAKLRRGASPVGFSLSGPLDAPDVNIDTGALLGGSLPIPGADALLNKAPKGIGKLLRGLLGGGSSPTPPAPSGSAGGSVSPGGATPPPARSTGQQPAPSQKFRPEDLLKQLFK